MPPHTHTRTNTHTHIFGCFLCLFLLFLKVSAHSRLQIFFPFFLMKCGHVRPDFIWTRSEGTQTTLELIQPVSFLPVTSVHSAQSPRALPLAPCPTGPAATARPFISLPEWDVCVSVSLPYWDDCTSSSKQKLPLSLRLNSGLRKEEFCGFSSPS